MFSLGMAAKSKLLDHPPLAVDQLHLHEPGQEADMVKPLGGALAGQLLVLAQECGQFERLEVVGEQNLGSFSAHAASSEIRHI